MQKVVFGFFCVFFLFSLGFFVFFLWVFFLFSLFFLIAHAKFCYA